MKFQLFSLVALFVSPLAFADNVLHPTTPVLDRPTLTTLGVQMIISGDDNFNASVTVQYRKTGTTTWKPALPLFRVHPESTAGYAVQPQFAGSIFDLRPNTSYDIQLHAVDTDGPVDQTFNLTGVTRPVPSDPPNPRIVNVYDVPSLNQAIGSAQAGDIITLADGFYATGTLYVFASGTAQNPIVIRGTTQAGTILDAGGCNPCNAIEVYGNYVHVENMTVQNAERGLRYQTVGSTGNVLRRVRVTNVIRGVFDQAGQTDFYIADNIFEGRLQWPLTYGSDGGQHSFDDGIVLGGAGHVIAHNRISGFADSMQINQQGSRAMDFYGNESLWNYDDGVELDESEGNTRAFRNRWTNTFDGISLQPVLGGPTYVWGNVLVNVAGEQMKFHALGTTPPEETNGVLAFNNTFVSPGVGLYMDTPSATHHFKIENNLFITGQSLFNQEVNWGGPIDDGLFDYDAYNHDGVFTFNFLGTGYKNFSSFAQAQANGLESHGLLFSGSPFANGMIGPDSYTGFWQPQDAALAANASVIDRALLLANINDSYRGAGPDLGALESGCPEPTYGPRPVGTDESNEIRGCVDVSSAPQPTAVLTGVTLQPITVTAGNPSTGTVTLSAPAGSGGAVVTLVSSQGSVASLPSSVTVIQGATTATFAVSTVSGSANASVNIAATYSGTTQSTTLTVNAAPPVASLSSVTLAPGTVTAGNSSTGTVTLSAAAGAGGAVVALSSSQPGVASVPLSVTVLQGAATATFAVGTVSSSPGTSVTISANYAGVTQATTLTVNAAPPVAVLSGITVNPTSTTGGTAVTGTVTLSATAGSGGATVSLTSSQSGAASVPATVTIVQGAAYANFTIPTMAVSANTTVNISATYSGVTQSAMLAVNAPASQTPGVTSISLNSNSLAQGATTAGTITVGMPAGSFGAAILLTVTPYGAVSAPLFVLIPQGMTSAPFQLTANGSAGTVVKISATYWNVSQSTSLTIGSGSQTPVLSSVTTSSNSVTAGGSITGTVRLSAAAASGGAVVALSSSQGSAASVPASVTVPQGASTANFPITTPANTGTANVTISGMYAGVTQSATLIVNAAAALSGVSVAPNSVTAGASPTGTVQLSAAAGLGGAVVALSSSQGSAASVPASITVPQGALSASFPVTTPANTGTANVTISGTYAGVTQSATLTVNAVVPVATLSSVSLASNALTAGGSTTGTVTLSAAAATGGVTVALASSQANSASVPGSVFVPQGSASAQFSVTTNSSSATANLNISASYAGVTQSAALTVNAVVVTPAPTPTPAPTTVVASATFVASDANTQGNWKGTYGADGYLLSGDATLNPSYVTPVVSAGTTNTWASGTNDVRALQQANGPGRIASSWSSNVLSSVDLNFTDGNTHQIAVYFLDWDNNPGARVEGVSILDANGKLLDSRIVSSFNGGQYLVWNVTGHVKLMVVDANFSATAVFSGVFFR